MALTGPFPSDQATGIVPVGYPGVYVLSRDGRTASYVGRSDSELGVRIRQSAAEGPGYRWFWYDLASSPMDAYRKECWLYHHYEGGLHNLIHPAVPTGANWRCPVERCPWA